MDTLNAISLFSSSVIGDLGLHANGIKTVVACELLKERMQLFQHNNPDTKCFCGDIWELKDRIIDYYQSTFKNEPFLILATNGFCWSISREMFNGKSELSTMPFTKRK